MLQKMNMILNYVVTGNTLPTHFYGEMWKPIAVNPEGVWKNSQRKGIGLFFHGVFNHTWLLYRG